MIYVQQNDYGYLLYCECLIKMFLSLTYYYFWNW